MKVFSCLLEGQLLVKRAGCLVTIPAGLPNHVQNGCFCGRYCGGPKADKYPLRPNSFSRQIVGAGRSPLYPECYYSFSLQFLRVARHKEGHIRTDGIPQGVGRLEHGSIRVFYAGDSAVILHSDIYGAAVSIGKGDYCFFDVIHILPFELNRPALCQHASITFFPAILMILIIIIIRISQKAIEFFLYSIKTFDIIRS